MRQKVLARRFWSRTAAMMVAMISWGMVEIRKMLTVLKREFQKNLSCSTSAKFWNPTNSPWPLSRCQSKRETKNV
ncbi:hypothetical protein D3C85_1578050 [compost metagenome]